MNYDDWKLATPDYEEMVSHCCGAEYWESRDWEETEADYICDCCDDECEIVEKYEYDISEREARAEMRMDEERLERD